MKVLLTGANGFVGSHILDTLVERGLPAVVLLRPGANRRWIEPNLAQCEIRAGSITDPSSLEPALRGITHVIHCAGRTKALRTEEYYATNEAGTRNLVDAVNRAGRAVQRFVCVSSLAASRPAVASAPAREDDPPQPVSEYGRSKLAGEEVVRRHCRAPFVILRPPGVYGPRDTDFLQLFRAVRRHLLPSFGGGSQPLSLVYVRDLARATVLALEHPAAPEVATPLLLARRIAEALGTWTVPLPLPWWGLWAVCLAQETGSRITGRPGILSRQKYLEARAAGWVCNVTRLREELGVECGTDLREGVARTRDWYRGEGWL